MSDKHGELWRCEQCDGCYKSESTGCCGHTGLECWLSTGLGEERVILTPEGQRAISGDIFDCLN